MFLRGFAVFDRLEDTIESECELVKVNSIVDKVLELILKGKGIFSGRKGVAEADLGNIRDTLYRSKDSIRDLQLEKKTSQGATSQSGRRRQLTTRATNDDEMDRISNDIIEAKV